MPKPEQKPHRIELNLREMGQLFNTMDPAPFQEKDLDSDAEEFIWSWVREFPLDEPVVLVVHLAAFPADEDPQAVIDKGVRNYFAYRARMNKLEFHRLLKEGWQTLIIGVVFLTICLTLAHAITTSDTGAFPRIAGESLTIAGWVAMWRPMQIYLYDWWPLRRRGKLYVKLSRMKVEVRKKT
jgi:hypothetical protein